VITAVDSSVLLDVLLGDAVHGAASEAALHRASTEGVLILGETVLEEIVPVLPGAEAPRWLADWQLKFVPSSQESALLAGEMFRAYLARGGKRGRVLADFLIGAHASVHAQRLLARDRGFFRDYFKQLTVLDPSK
jgi:predicted nucleic acid-binding protein